MRHAQEVASLPVSRTLKHLGLASSTYYDWRERQSQGRLGNVVVVPKREALPLTPEEVAAVRAFALSHPQMGYKRLSWQMLNEDVAALRPHQVYQVLCEQGLLARRPASVPESLRRAPEPNEPDAVWHIDLMYLYIGPQWYYLVDILDGYSRYLVHWTLNLTMVAETVTLTVQEALEGLPSRKPGHPHLVHDHGSQFVSSEWRAFVEAAQVVDIKTRVAHPQSNGRLERLHRTHRAEGLPGELLSDYYQALDRMTAWGRYYNEERAHSALRYLRPIDFYRGDPAARLAERQEKLARAAQARRDYWEAAKAN